MGATASVAATAILARAMSARRAPLVPSARVVMAFLAGRAGRPLPSPSLPPFLSQTHTHSLACARTP
eukprot:3635350-Rhodomonas_salina.3